METTKTKFQALHTEIERLLEDLKNAYPKNYSEMVQSCMRYFVLIATVVVIINIIFASSYGLYLLFGVPYAAVIVFLFYRIFHKFSNKNAKDADSTVLKSKILAAKEEFGEYPDVVNYLDKTYEGVQATIDEKYRIKSLVSSIFCGLFLIAVIITFVRVNNYKNRWSDYIENFEAALGVDSNTPLARILPFKTEVTDSIRLPYDRLKIYGFYKGLAVATPGFIYADGYNSQNDLYLLKITDQNGNPLPKCPDFYFECNEESVSARPRFNRDGDGEYYEPLRLLLSIKDNQDNLRYVVEKL